MSSTENPVGAAWRADVKEFLYACAAADADDQHELLRAAQGLFAAAGDPRAFAACLVAGAWESAALALLPRGAGVMLSRGTNGASLASVVLPDCTEEFTAEGPTMALALMAALADACLAEPKAGRSQPLRAVAAARLN